MKIEPQGIWDLAKGKKKPGVTVGQLNKWENAKGVKLPQFLRQALLAQNGGKIRYSDIEIHPLQRFARPDEDFWEFAETDGFKRSEQCFEFATDERDGRPFYLLRFKAKGLTGEPSVYHHYNDGSVYKTASTIEKFFEDLIVVDVKPAVDWSEIKTLDKILFEEKTTVSHGRTKTVVECVVGRRGGKLFHYRHEISGRDEVYLKVQMTEPLDPEEAHIETYPGSVHGLNLRSKQEKGTVEVESKRMADGSWKNSDSCSLSDDVQSADRKRLEALRRQLLGKNAAQAEVDDKNTLEWQALGEKVQAMPKAESKAAGEKLAMHLLAQMNGMLAGEEFDFEQLNKSSLGILRKSVGGPGKNKK